MQKHALFFLLAFSALAGAEEKYWVFFTDKGRQSVDLRRLQSTLTERALTRRAKVSSSLVDSTDAPLYAPYLTRLAELGLKPVTASKWLNGVSVRATEAQLAVVRGLPFVRRVQPVARGRRLLPPDETVQLRKSDAPLSYDYGFSFTQNAMIRIPEVHALGVTGEGVIIAVMDAGFSLKHPAFARMKVIAKRDFINDDDEPDNEPGDPPGQDDHGTKVLSILGGYAPGSLIGPAFDASFILAKTEDISSETPVEEDYWIAAAEWAESLGADVFNTSLGYIDWYTYADMNGRTAPITLAADLAVQKGVVVVTSAGNEGNSGWRYISAPADGFDVIAVGAVHSDSTIASFSSRGPTSDGRIKPEVTAMGVGNVFAEPSGQGYGSGSGTSYSSPLVAGTAALILSAHPELTPRQVRTALLMTADRAASPDNAYGFGLVNALAAVNYWGVVGDPAEENRFVALFPNPYAVGRGDGLRFVVDLKEPLTVSVDLYSVTGRCLGRIIEASLPGNRRQILTWDGRAPSGVLLPSGVYFCRIRVGEGSWVAKVTLIR